MKQWMLLLTLQLVLALSYGQTIQLSRKKTTSLIFPYSIKHIDRGSQDILVQPVKEPDNVLLIKAESDRFMPTNLSVITSDGGIYSLAVEFAADPTVSVYYMQPLQNASLNTYAFSILDNPRTVHGINSSSWGIRSAITGIYIRNQVIFYQLRIENYSAIDYDIDFIRFYIRDKKKSKRTASQENELKPLYVAGNNRAVKANSATIISVALDKFTLPDAKYLAIEINEHNGGRHLFMKINNRKIVKAIPLPDLK